MKTHFVDETKIASISRLGRIASLAALLVMVCFSSGAWGQSSTPVNVVGHTPIHIEIPPGARGIYWCMSPGLLVIEYVNIASSSFYPWSVWVSGEDLYSHIALSSTSFLVTPTRFPGGTYFGSVSAPVKTYLDCSGNNRALELLFSNGLVNDQNAPLNMTVELWGYFEPPSQTDDS